jgi:hypothetical protein
MPLRFILEAALMLMMVMLLVLVMVLGLLLELVLVWCGTVARPNALLGGADLALAAPGLLLPINDLVEVEEEVSAVADL